MFQTVTNVESLPTNYYLGGALEQECPEYKRLQKVISKWGSLLGNEGKIVKRLLMHNKNNIIKKSIDSIKIAYK